MEGTVEEDHEQQQEEQQDQEVKKKKRIKKKPQQQDEVDDDNLNEFDDDDEPVSVKKVKKKKKKKTRSTVDEQQDDDDDEEEKEQATADQEPGEEEQIPPTEKKLKAKKKKTRRATKNDNAEGDEEEGVTEEKIEAAHSTLVKQLPTPKSSPKQPQAPRHIAAPVTVTAPTVHVAGSPARSVSASPSHPPVDGASLTVPSIRSSPVSPPRTVTLPPTPVSTSPSASPPDSPRLPPSTPQQREQQQREQALRLQVQLQEEELQREEQRRAQELKALRAQKELREAEEQKFQQRMEEEAQMFAQQLTAQQETELRLRAERVMKLHQHQESKQSYLSPPPLSPRSISSPRSTSHVRPILTAPTSIVTVSPYTLSAAPSTSFYPSYSSHIPLPNYNPLPISDSSLFGQYDQAERARRQHEEDALRLSLERAKFEYDRTQAIKRAEQYQRQQREMEQEKQRQEEEQREAEVERIRAEIEQQVRMEETARQYAEHEERLRLQQEEREREQERARLTALLPKQGVDLIIDYVTTKGLLVPPAVLQASEAQRMIDLFHAPATHFSPSSPVSSPSHPVSHASSLSTATDSVIATLSSLPPTPFVHSIDLFLHLYQHLINKVKQHVKQQRDEAKQRWTTLNTQKKEELQSRVKLIQARLQDECKQCSLAMSHTSTSSREEVLLLSPTSSVLSSISTTLLSSEPLLQQLLQSRLSSIATLLHDAEQLLSQLTENAQKHLQQQIRQLLQTVDQDIQELSKLHSKHTIRTIERRTEQQLEHLCATSESQLQQSLIDAVTESVQIVRKLTDEGCVELKQHQQQAQATMEKFVTILREQIAEERAEKEAAALRIAAAEGARINIGRRTLAAYLSSDQCHLFTYTDNEVELNGENLDGLINAAGGDVQITIDTCQRIQKQQTVKFRSVKELSHECEKQMKIQRAAIEDVRTFLSTSHVLDPHASQPTTAELHQLTALFVPTMSAEDLLSILRTLELSLYHPYHSTAELIAAVTERKRSLLSTLRGFCEQHTDQLFQISGTITFSDTQLEQLWSAAGTVPAVQQYCQTLSAKHQFFSSIPELCDAVRQERQRGYNDLLTGSVFTLFTPTPTATVARSIYIWFDALRGRAGSICYCPAEEWERREKCVTQIIPLHDITALHTGKHTTTFTTPPASTIPDTHCCAIESTDCIVDLAAVGEEARNAWLSSVHTLVTATKGVQDGGHMDVYAARPQVQAQSMPLIAESRAQYSHAPQQLQLSHTQPLPVNLQSTAPHTRSTIPPSPHPAAAFRPQPTMNSSHSLSRHSLSTHNLKPLPVYTLQQVAQHNHAGDCWIALQGHVYNITTWIDQHPGGREVLLSIAGTDATQHFLTAHGPKAMHIADTIAHGMKIGTLDNITAVTTVPRFHAPPTFLTTGAALIAYVPTPEVTASSVYVWYVPGTVLGTLYVGSSIHDPHAMPFPLSECSDIYLGCSQPVEQSVYATSLNTEHCFTLVMHNSNTVTLQCSHRGERDNWFYGLMECVRVNADDTVVMPHQSQVTQPVPILDTPSLLDLSSLDLLTTGIAVTAYNHDTQHKLASTRVLLFLQRDEGMFGALYYCLPGTRTIHRDNCLPVHTIRSVLVGRQSAFFQTPETNGLQVDTLFTLTGDTTVLHLQCDSAVLRTRWLAAFRELVTGEQGVMMKRPSTSALVPTSHHHPSSPLQPTFFTTLTEPYTNVVIQQSIYLWVEDGVVYWCSAAQWSTRERAVERSIRLRDITDMYTGKQSARFHSVTAKQYDVTHCFTLVTPTMQLDLVAVSEEERTLWLTTLHQLLVSGGKQLLDSAVPKTEVYRPSAIAIPATPVTVAADTITLEQAVEGLSAGIWTYLHTPYTRIFLHYAPAQGGAFYWNTDRSYTVSHARRWGVYDIVHVQDEGLVSPHPEERSTITLTMRDGRIVKWCAESRLDCADLYCALYLILSPSRPSSVSLSTVPHAFTTSSSSPSLLAPHPRAPAGPRPQSASFRGRVQ